MYSISKALLLCGLYLTSNAQYNVYQVTAQQNPTATATSTTSWNQQQSTSQISQNNHGYGQGQNQNINQQDHSNNSNQNHGPLPPANQGQQCVQNNNFNKINCSNKGKSQCAKPFYGASSPFTTCGVSHLGVKYDFHDECQVCNSGQIDFYFQCSCEHTPVICNSNQQCVNGSCVKIITQQPPNNCDCHTDADCTQGSQICQNYKCVAKKWNNSTKQSSRPKNSNSNHSRSNNASKGKSLNNSNSKNGNNPNSKDRNNSVSNEKHPLRAARSGPKRHQKIQGATQYQDECSSSKNDIEQDSKSTKLINRVNYHLNKQLDSNKNSTNHNASNGKDNSSVGKDNSSNGKDHHSNNSNNSRAFQKSNASKSGRSNRSGKLGEQSKDNSRGKQGYVVPPPKPGPTPILVPGVNC